VDLQNENIPGVSIIVCTYNHASYIDKCIKGILSQTFQDFELIIIDDGSTDNTREIVESFDDPRIRYIKYDQNSGSIGKIRNQAVSYARGEYIFFTDSDCIPKFDWIETGLTALKEDGVFVIEGKLIYNREGYKPTLSERKVSNESGGMWMNANMAFRKMIFEEFNYDPTMRRQEDRELALRIQSKYSIPFIPSCIVYHQILKRTIRRYINEATNLSANEMVRLFREYGDKNEMFSNRFRIYAPQLIIILLFPPVLIAEFILGRIKSRRDLILLPFVWVKAAYLRYLVWKAAIKHRIFVI
jgi:glycosyltransferase involved in cell wall biosynthesis